MAICSVRGPGGKEALVCAFVLTLFRLTYLLKMVHLLHISIYVSFLVLPSATYLASDDSDDDNDNDDVIAPRVTPL